MTDWTRRSNFFAVDHAEVDEIGVYDVSDNVAISIIGFNGKRASMNVIPEFKEYARRYSIMTAYDDVPMSVVEAFIERYLSVDAPTKYRGRSEA